MVLSVPVGTLAMISCQAVAWGETLTAILFRIGMVGLGFFALALIIRALSRGGRSGAMAVSG